MGQTEFGNLFLPVPTCLLSMDSQAVSHCQQTCPDILFSHSGSLLSLLIPVFMPAGNSAVTKSKHDSKRNPQKSKTKKPNSFSPFPSHISAKPVLWLPMWPQLLIWSCLPLRPGWSSPGVSRRLIAVFHLSTASFWARGQHFLTPTASSGLEA